MNVNDLVDAFGLPRNYATRLPAGSSIIATVKPDGSVAIQVHQSGAFSDHLVANELGQVVGVKSDTLPEPFDLRSKSSVLPVVEQKRGPGRPPKAISE